MSKSGHPLSALIDALVKLPGVGPKTAERLAYHLLLAPKEEALALSEAIRVAREEIRFCEECFFLSRDRLCHICQDSRRDRELLCIVESPRDVIALERTAGYQGYFHVLLGRLAPLEGVDATSLTIPRLLERLKKRLPREIILATSPTFEGDATLAFLRQTLAPFQTRVTALSRGLPSGTEFTHSSAAMLREALEERRQLPPSGD